jgi:integrase/recombinase XerD
MAPPNCKIDLPDIDGQRGIPMHDWSQQDKIAWDQLLTGRAGRFLSIHEVGERLSRRGYMRQGMNSLKAGKQRRGQRSVPKALSFARQKQFAATYGLWLGYLRHIGALNTDVPPAERITPERIAGFVNLLALSRCSDSTAHTYAVRLLEIARRMGPARDWAWLEAIVRRLSPPPPDPTADLDKVRSPPELLALAEHLMTDNTVPPTSRNARREAVRYRDGLMLALLVVTVIRRRSLLSLKLDRSLTRTDDGYRLVLQAQDTKSRRPEVIPLAGWLTGWIDRYLDVHRPVLLKPQSDEQAMWISDQGKPLGPKGAWEAVSSRTEAALGIRINPHFIRKCVATWQAVQHPERIVDLPSLMQHTNYRMTEQHYMLANNLVAGQRWHDTLAAERRELSAPSLSAVYQKGNCC